MVWDRIPARRGRVSRLAVALLVMALAIPAAPAPAHAKTVTQLKAELESLKAETRKAGAEFDRAYWKVDEASVRISKVDKKIAKTKKELKRAKKVLNQHAAASYRRDGLSMIDVVVSAASFEQLVTRMDYIRRVGESDAQVIKETKELSAKLRSQRKELVSEKKAAAAELGKFRKRRDQLQARLKGKQAQFKRVKAQLDAARGGRSSGTISRPGPNGMVFPVVGSYYYSNTWGASRSGGRRRHQGTDIMAPTGTPVVAILSGRVRSKTNGLGGKTIWLTADNGWQFYYAHLNSWKVRSGRVRAGQVIGTVGATGNARGGAPHLHLQVHPGGGSPVNPYPYLRSME